MLRRKVAILPYTGIHQTPTSLSRHCAGHTQMSRTPSCPHGASSSKDDGTRVQTACYVMTKGSAKGLREGKVTSTWGSREASFLLVGVSAVIDHTEWRSRKAIHSAGQNRDSSLCRNSIQGIQWHVAWALKNQ